MHCFLFRKQYQVYISLRPAARGIKHPFSVCYSNIMNILSRKLGLTFLKSVLTKCSPPCNVQKCFLFLIRHSYKPYRSCARNWLRTAFWGCFGGCYQNIIAHKLCVICIWNVYVLIWGWFCNPLADMHAFGSGIKLLKSAVFWSLLTFFLYTLT